MRKSVTDDSAPIVLKAETGELLIGIDRVEGGGWGKEPRRSFQGGAGLLFFWPHSTR